MFTSSSSSSRTRFKAVISIVSRFFALNTVPYVPKIETQCNEQLYLNYSEYSVTKNCKLTLKGTF